MTAGEKRVAEILRTQLDDACMVWYDIPVGKKRRYPDFVILHPRRGLLFLEVKDWKTTTFKNISSTSAQILTSKGMSTEANPLEQARAYSMEVINMLQADKALQQIEGLHKGRLKIPYGHGVVLSHIPRKNMFAALAADAREKVLPDHLVLYQEDLHDGVDAETIQEQLWGMFPYQFGEALSAAEVDRVRWHLFPEIRIDAMALQGQLFAEEPLAETVETVFKRPVNSDLAAFRPLKAVRSASLMMSLKEAMLTPRPMTKAPNANKRAGALTPNTMCSFCQWRKAAYTVSAISWRSWRPSFLWSLKNFDNTMSAGERNRLTSAIRRSVWMSCGLFI